MRILSYEVPLGMSISEDLPSSIPAFVDAGFTHFEVGLPAKVGGRGTEEKLVEDARPYVEALQAINMRPWSFHLPFGKEWDIAHYDETERAAVCASLKKLMAMVGNWGAKIFVIHGGLEPVILEQRSVRIAHGIISMQELDAFARTFGMRIALENLPRSCLANCALETYAMSRAAGDLPVVFDVNHLLMEDHATFLATMAPFIQSTHLSDYDNVNERHWLPGKGVVPWRLIVERLQAAGYRGPYLFELTEPEDRKFTPAEIIEAFRKAVEG